MTTISEISVGRGDVTVTTSDGRQFKGVRLRLPTTAWNKEGTISRYVPEELFVNEAKVTQIDDVGNVTIDVKGVGEIKVLQVGVPAICPPAPLMLVDF